MQLDALGQETPARCLARASGHEADLLAVRLGRRRQPERAGAGADLGFGELSDREQDVGELAHGEHGEHIGLVLGGVSAAQQPRLPARGSAEIRA